MKNNDRQPKKSILRKSSDKNLSLNQNNSIILTQKSKSLIRRKVLFTHVDSYEFDPQMPCRFINSPQREQFYLSPNDKQMQCLCHRNLKATFQNKSKIKRKRE